MSMPLPALGGNVLHRPRLSQLLDAAVQRPVTLLTAPAGWGKTSALRSWLDHRAETGPVAWLNLRSASALEEVGQLVESLLADAPAGPLLVLDDVPSGEAAAGLVANLAASSPLRLVVAARDSRTLPVPRWRLADQVCELGCAELSFTRDETTDLMAQQGPALSTVELDAVYARTEGWPAGLRFATMRAGCADPLTEEQQDVGRYLDGEVLAALPPRTRDLLRRSSLLDRVSGELATALLADPSSPFWTGRGRT